MGNKYFPLFNQDIARAITGNGRYFIHKLANKIEEKLQSMLSQDKKYIIYGDTDSCDGKTIINTSQGDIKIEDLYNLQDGSIEVRGENNFIKHITHELKVKSYDITSEKIQEKPVNYIMAHRVKKRMFKITHNNDSVIVTEDHSLVIKRGESYVDVKPQELRDDDVIIKILY